MGAVGSEALAADGSRDELSWGLFLGRVALSAFPTLVAAPPGLLAGCLLTVPTLPVGGQPLQGQELPHHEPARADPERAGMPGEPDSGRWPGRDPGQPAHHAVSLHPPRPPWPAHRAIPTPLQPVGSLLTAMPVPTVRVRGGDRGPLRRYRRAPGPLQGGAPSVGSEEGWAGAGARQWLWLPPWGRGPCGWSWEGSLTPAPSAGGPGVSREDGNYA